MKTFLLLLLLLIIVVYLKKKIWKSRQFVNLFELTRILIFLKIYIHYETLDNRKPCKRYIEDSKPNCIIGIFIFYLQTMQRAHGIRTKTTLLIQTQPSWRRAIRDTTILIFLLLLCSIIYACLYVHTDSRTPIHPHTDIYIIIDSFETESRILTFTSRGPLSRTPPPPQQHQQQVHGKQPFYIPFYCHRDEELFSNSSAAMRVPHSRVCI